MQMVLSTVVDDVNPNEETVLTDWLSLATWNYERLARYTIVSEPDNEIKTSHGIHPAPINVH